MGPRIRGTVADEKVGALMHAAAKIDTSLFTEALVCRDWLTRMISDEEFRSEWLTRYVPH